MTAIEMTDTPTPENRSEDLSEELPAAPRTDSEDAVNEAADNPATENAAADRGEPVAGEAAIGGELLEQIVEGALLAAGKPLAIADLGKLFEDHERPSATALRAALETIAERSRGRGFELREVASGFRFQVVQDVAPWIARLWEEKPQRYSRALLETLALIAYRQPITRGDIEDIRGVAVASNIMKTLLEREWVRIVGHKDVPGRPAMYATTRKFLDYFNLKNLDDLPALAEIRDLDTLNAELSWEGADTPAPDSSDAATDDTDTDATDTEAADTDAQATPHAQQVDSAESDSKESDSAEFDSADAVADAAIVTAADDGEMPDSPDDAPAAVDEDAAGDEPRTE